MSDPVTAIELAFADGRYLFWLPMAQVTELERRITERGGPSSIFALEWKLRSGMALTEDGGAVFVGGDAVTVHAIRGTIRLGLVGGNRSLVDGEAAEVGPQRAGELLDAYVYPARPLAEAAAVAWRVLSAAIYGNEVRAPSGEEVEAADA